MRERRLPALDALTGLRFFAAFYVLAYHFTPSISLPTRLRAFVAHGFWSVGFFFVLSGFILAYAYCGRLRDSQPDPFYRARFARIYPVYALSILIALPYYVLSGLALHQSAPRLVAQSAATLGLVQSWYPPTAFDLNTPAWSLSVETLFYLSFPFLARWLLTLDERRARLATALAALSTIAVYFPIAYIVSRYSPGSPGILFWTVFPPFALPQFIFGITLGRLFLTERKEPSNAMLAFMGWGAMAGIVVATQFKGAIFLNQSGSMAILFGLVIWALAHRRGWANRLLSSRPIVALGEASYSLYILHIPLYWYLLALLSRTGLETSLPKVVSRLGLVLVLVAVSLLTHRFVEIPARDRLRPRSLPPPLADEHAGETADRSLPEAESGDPAR